MSKSNEWYTPAKYIIAAREVMGSINLDPASCAQANETVKADRYYTKEENGLLLPWYGNVWLNPPFSSDGSKLYQRLWGMKLYLDWSEGRVQQAILVVYSHGKNKWFHELWDLYDCLVSLPYKRLHFALPSGKLVELMYPVWFFYLGENNQKFIDCFKPFGTILQHAGQRKDIPLQLAL